jgi:DNA-binding CsgD family transcriptional regulator
VETRGPNVQLSERQREVFDLIGRGLTNGEIATKLDLSFATAKWYVSDLISLYGVGSREDLIDEWRAERGLRRRLARLARGLLAFPAKAAIATAVTGGAAVAVTAIAVVAFDGAGSSPAAAISTMTPTSRTSPFLDKTVTAPPNIVRVQPADGASVPRSQFGQPTGGSAPAGLCAEINFVGLQHNFQEFRAYLDDVEVTTKLYLYADSVNAPGGTICLGSAPPPAGFHRARIVVADPLTGALREPPYEWTFTVLN